MHYRLNIINRHWKIVENIINVRSELDPSSFVTLPSLSWEAALKTTRVEHELLTDNNMIIFIKKLLEE